MAPQVLVFRLQQLLTVLRAQGHTNRALLPAPALLPALPVQLPTVPALLTAPPVQSFTVPALLTALLARVLGTALPLQPLTLPALLIVLPLQ